MKICAVEACGRPVKGKGLCTAHYQHFQKHGRTFEIKERLVPVSKFCTFPQCDKPHKAKGFCKNHYWKFLSGRTTHREECSVDDCKSLSTARGFCQKHYQRFMKHGDALTSYQRPRKSQYVSVENVTNNRGTYSISADANVLKEFFGEKEEYSE